MRQKEGASQRRTLLWEAGWSLRDLGWHVVGVEGRGRALCQGMRGSDSRRRGLRSAVAPAVGCGDYTPLLSATTLAVTF